MVYTFDGCGQGPLLLPGAGDRSSGVESQRQINPPGLPTSQSPDISPTCAMEADGPGGGLSTAKKYINKYINTVSGSIHLFHICSTSPLPFFRGTGIVLLDLTGHQLSAVVYPL